MVCYPWVSYNNKPLSLIKHHTWLPPAQLKHSAWASCFHQFPCVWKPLWNPCTCFWNSTSSALRKVQPVVNLNSFHFLPGHFFVIHSWITWTNVQTTVNIWNQLYILCHIFFISVKLCWSRVHSATVWWIFKLPSCSNVPFSLNSSLLWFNVANIYLYTFWVEILFHSFFSTIFIGLFPTCDNPILFQCAWKV